MKKLNAIISSQVNRSLVLTQIYTNPNISRVELAQITGLGRSAITHILQDLLKEGLVEEVSRLTSSLPRGGRPRILLQIKPEARSIAAIAIDLADATAVLSDLEGKELARKVFPIERGEKPPQFVSKVMNSLKAENRKAFESLAIAGISAPGVVDPLRGIIVNNMYHDWHEVELSQHVQDQFGIPCFVENNAKLAALGELNHLRRESPHNTLVYLYLRESPNGMAVAPLAIGGAAILEGSIWHGANLYAGEVSGEINTQYMERMESLKKSRPEIGNMTFSEFARLARKGDKDAIGALALLAERTGSVLGIIATFMDPETVLIHCRPSEMADDLMPLIEAPFRANFHPMRNLKISLQRAPLGEQAQIRGIIQRAQSELFVTDTSRTSPLFAPRQSSGRKRKPAT